MTMNHEERLARVEQQSQAVMAAVDNIPGIKVQMLENIMGHQPFGVRLDFDSNVHGLTSQDVVRKLKEGDPPIWTRVREGEDFIVIHMFGLNDGEERIVGERIADLFG